VKKKTIGMAVFQSESEEADWWASREGREFVKQKSSVLRATGTQARRSRLVANLNKTSSGQIELRLPETDLAKARKIATLKGIGYQTLLKMLIHEGLEREGRRH
jgi:predicted DNA binding CopG/RHH family protein